MSTHFLWFERWRSPQSAACMAEKANLPATVCQRQEAKTLAPIITSLTPFFAEKLPISPVSSPSSAVYKSSTSLLNNLLYTMLFYRQGLTSINTLTQLATHSLIGSTERNPWFPRDGGGLDRQAGLLAAVGYTTQPP